jgi:8-oxo-dGTP pyrophosphatase MutT (NUDIX family)
MTPTKACPVVVRREPSGDQLLVFRHPKAGVQLVKGTIEHGEDPASAAVRELAEESGLLDARVVRSIGIWSPGYEHQVWAFLEILVPPAVPEEWTHRTDDAGGLEFSFFWHPFCNEWHWLYVAAFEYLAGHFGLSEKSVRCASRLTSTH